MLDQEEQKRLVDLIAEKAAERGCFVAPIGSVFFLFQDSGRGFTKDVDVVIHTSDMGVADLRLLETIGRSIGEAEVSEDKAVVNVWVKKRSTAQGPEIELVRGRRKAGGGYIPRELLNEAARLAKRSDNIILYPEEFVLVLKADAAIDREKRAKADPSRAAANQARAEVFRSDVFDQTRRMSFAKGVDHDLVEAAVSYLKKSRQDAVRALLESAGAL